MHKKVLSFVFFLITSMTIEIIITPIMLQSTCIWLGPWKLYPLSLLPPIIPACCATSLVTETQVCKSACHVYVCVCVRPVQLNVKKWSHVCLCACACACARPHPPGGWRGGGAVPVGGAAVTSLPGAGAEDCAGRGRLFTS